MPQTSSSRLHAVSINLSYTRPPPLPFLALRDIFLIRCEVDSEMEPSDYRVVGIGCDVSSELSVQQAFRRVMDTYGRVDSVVASAGASYIHRLRGLCCACPCLCSSARHC